jgi:hypothetical protein
MLFGPYYYFNNWHEREAPTESLALATVSSVLTVNYICILCSVTCGLNPSLSFCFCFLSLLLLVDFLV